METETEKIFAEQLAKLPRVVVDFISSTNWDTDAEEIGSLYNLSGKALSDFTREVTFVLMGIIHPDEFSEVLEQELGIKGAILEALVANVENKIFAYIRPALIEFFEKEVAEIAKKEVAEGALAQEETATIPTTPPEPAKLWEKAPDVAPENLPTDEEGESLLPPIPLKFGAEGASAPAHPFEEKMKKVFTAGQQSLGDLAIEPPSQTPSPTQESKAPPIFHADPYREPIE